MHARSTLSIFLLAFAALLGSCTSAVAQNAEGKRGAKENPSLKASAAAVKADAANRKVRAARQIALTPAREAAAMDFARAHHAELADLVAALKARRPKQYEQAARQLFQASERMARIRERDPEKYELDLEAWKLDSRIRLLAARLTMQYDPQLDENLRELVQARSELRLRQLTAERDRIAERVERIDRLIAEIDSDPAAAADRELQRVKRSIAGRGRAAKRPSAARRDKASAATAQPVAAPVPRPAKSSTNNEKSRNR